MSLDRDQHIKDKIMNKVQRIKDITRDQKQSIILLSVGTFLEYFDLMLYVNMAVLLNELFFQQKDRTQSRKPARPAGR